MAIKWFTNESTGMKIMLDPLDFAGIDIGDSTYKEPEESVNTIIEKVKDGKEDKQTKKNKPRKTTEDTKPDNENIEMETDNETYSIGFLEENEDDSVEIETIEDSETD